MSLSTEIFEALTEIPVMDVHTHLVGGRLGARGLHDILLYHMLVSDLYTAGCPSGNRLTEYPNWPDVDEAHARIQEAIPYLAKIQNTSGMWGVRTILADLYQWHDPITESNWRRLDDLIRERSDDRAWHHGLLDRMKVQRTCAEYARRGAGEDDDRLQYSLEWGMFTRCQWGEFDTAIYDLERTWGRQPESPVAIGKNRPPTDRTIRSLEDVHAAIRHYVSAIPYGKVISTATHLSTDINYELPTDDRMAEAISRRDIAGPAERDIYAAYISEAFLTELEKREDEIVFQFSLGAEPLPYETASRLSQETIRQIAEIIGRHPGLRFQCFLGCKHANQALCTLARELPNFSLAGYWWHNFFPQTIRHVMSERLDMLPINKQMGFFSDAYTVEWAHAKLAIVRRQMASVLAEKIEQGQYRLDDALAVARGVLFESPQELLGMRPREANSKVPEPSPPGPSPFSHETSKKERGGRVSTHWISFENPTGARNAGGRENLGSKGHAFDCVRAGETKTLLDLVGSGSIRRIWMTINDRSPEMLHALKLEMFWDGASTTAVSVPLGDFFGIALGYRTAFECALFSDPEGRSFNCFIQMPFRTSARVTLTNTSDKDLPLLFYDIDVLLGEVHSPETMYFHAQWRRESPNELGKEFVILPRTEGVGRYLGCNIGVVANPIYDGSWWGEGEVKLRLGDDEFPTLVGTGTEDFIGTAWGQGVYAQRTQGCPIADKEARSWCFYRYHIDDPVYFEGGCQISIQTIGGDGKAKIIELQEKGAPLIPVSIDTGTPGGFHKLMDLSQPVDLKSDDIPTGWCNFWRQDDWSATAYYYLDRP